MKMQTNVDRPAGAGENDKRHCRDERPWNVSQSIETVFSHFVQHRTIRVDRHIHIRMGARVQCVLFERLFELVADRYHCLILLIWH